MTELWFSNSLDDHAVAFSHQNQSISAVEQQC